MYTNYHTHTVRCGHAADVPDESYVTTAIENGYSVLGFSDHTPWPYADGYQECDKRQRMPAEQLDDYIASVLGLAEKYRGQIEIPLGLECEYFPQYGDYLQELHRRCDYLLLGHHCSRNDEHLNLYYARSTLAEQVREYTSELLEGMESGLFACVAHPDLAYADYPVFDETCVESAHAICSLAEKLNLPLEYNIYGVDKQMRGRQKGQCYPCPKFWDIASHYKVCAILGMDAHDPKHLLYKDRIAESCAALEVRGIRRIERLTK